MRGAPPAGPFRAALFRLAAGMDGRKTSRVPPAHWRARGARTGGDRGRRILRADFDRDSLRRSNRADSAFEPFYRTSFWEAAHWRVACRTCLGTAIARGAG